MPIKVVCRCGRNLIVPDDRAGRMVECPKCGHKLRAPGEPKATDTKSELPPAKPAPTTKPPAPPLLQEKPGHARPAPKPEAKEHPGEAAERKPAAGERRPPPPLKAAPRAKPPAPPPLKKPPPQPAPQRLPPPEDLLESAEEDDDAFWQEALAQPAATHSEVAITAAPPEPPEPTQPPPETPRRFGYQHDPEKLAAALVLATLIGLLGIVTILPGVLEIVRYAADPDSDPIGRWAYLAFFLGALHLAYAVYLGQLADWSSAWVLTGMALVQGAFYAAILTTVNVAKGQSQLVAMLDLGPHIDNGQARAWCFVMLCLTGLAAYFCGWVSIRWRRAFLLVRTAHGQ